MRLVSFRVTDQIHYGVLQGNSVIDLVDDPGAASFREQHDCCSVLELLDAGADAIAAAEKAFEVGESLLSLDQLRLLAPVPRPGKLLALAGNYAEHLRESGHEWAEKKLTTPRLFMKPATAVTGPYDPIVYPRNGNNIDYEGEFGVVIGKNARFVEVNDAWDHVAGYVVVNDVSERSLKTGAERQDRDGDKWFDWLNGKWFDTFAPMGPALVTKDEVPDSKSLSLRTSVNGEVRQSSSTGQMIFDVAELIAWASRWMTLEPGDIIATGTPAGVGSSTGDFLKPGDVIEIEIESIGTIRNVVKQG